MADIEELLEAVELNIGEAGVLDITTPLLKDRDVWRELSEAFNEVMKANVDEPIRQLEFVRFLSPDADPEVMANVCRMLGFDLSQDILNMSQDKFTSLASQLGRYPDTNGTKDFTEFISLITNGNCSVEYLWTKDYVNFSTEPQGITLEAGGDWFMTTHVNLLMGFSSLQGLQLRDDQTLGQKIVEIFYQQAPATLVIKDKTFTVDIEVEEIGFGVSMYEVERVYDLYAAGGTTI